MSSCLRVAHVVSLRSEFECGGGPWRLLHWGGRSWRRVVAARARSSSRPKPASARKNAWSVNWSRRGSARAVRFEMSVWRAPSSETNRTACGVDSMKPNGDCYCVLERAQPSCRGHTSESTIKSANVTTCTAVHHSQMWLMINSSAATSQSTKSMAPMPRMNRAT